MADPRETPAMRQYYRFKRQHPDCLLLFRIGDFYETFDDDAVTISKAAGLTLTQRTEGVPMAGMPYHQIETYLRRLIDKGYRVAIADQVEDAAEAKARQAGLGGGGGSAVIDRAITRVVTPGTLVDETLLAPDAACALASVCFLDAGDAPEGRVAVAVAELSTGRFVVLECAAGALVDELARRQVSELLFAQTADGKTPPRVKSVLDGLGLAGTPQPSWHFRAEESLEAVLGQYGVATLDGFGIKRDDPVVWAAGALIRYLRQTQAAQEEGAAWESGSAGSGAASNGGRNGASGPTTSGKKRAVPTLAHLQPPRREATSGWLTLDATALRALEVLGTMRSDVGRVGQFEGVAGDGSLVGVFGGAGGGSGCRTAMGKRLLRDWLCRPLCDLAGIEARQSCIATLISDRRAAGELGEALGAVQDVSRMAARIALARATPRDVVGLGKSVGQVRVVADSLENAPAFTGQLDALRKIEGELAELAGKIAAACVDSPPAHLREGGLVRDGVDAELDEARLLQRDSALWMAEYQKTLIETHALPSLKVGYNRIFGYYIELPAAQSKRAPAEFTRKQTLKNAERFITPELREFERKVTTAETRAIARELAIFEALCAAAAGLIAQIATFADTVAELDVLLCFADKAARRGWARPEIVEEPTLRIIQGRHPVLDELLEGSGGGFVPNDVELGTQPELQAGDTGAAAGGAEASHATLALITGPNMAGKSTFIRQTALLVLLAHCGSYVPAAGATIGLTDRIFTRVGADDALHAGQSTFMVEMTETARILHHATARSLVVLDEIGRGTSTLDGLSLAWAIAETLGKGAASGEWRVGSGEGGDDATKRRSDEGRESGPRTLFATHYHELTRLEELMPGRVRNLHVSVREWGDEIVLLHRILPGKTDRSYGIHVAKLAGMPAGTVARAREVLESLAVHQAEGIVEGEAGGAGRAETGESGGAGARESAAAQRRARAVPAAGAPAPEPDGQLSLFTQYVRHPAVDELRELKLDALSPLEAFDQLRRLKGMAGE